MVFGASGRGPSPRGWGEHSAAVAAGTYDRTIPTRVGRTRRHHIQNFVTPDHPHAGGENLRRNSPPGISPGPSPRGWGEQLQPLDRRRLRRTIPTRVGRTNRGQPLGMSVADHPHAGGENHSRPRLIMSTGGPSPRGWGERRQEYGRSLPLRTIPTRVGRTDISAQSSLSPTDHPHAGGENIVMRARSTKPCGPSPRGWGELHLQNAVIPDARTIPTRVGRTTRTWLARGCTPDHPHAGGENKGRN